jgi:ParB-like chromosome segregation protein Spo0J
VGKRKGAAANAGETPKGAALEWIAEDLRPLAVPIDSLVPDPANANKHDDTSLAAIGASLAKFGQLKPIVVNVESGYIEAGNGTWTAAKRQGRTMIAVVRVRHDPTAHVGYAIADNRTAQLSEWDDVRLAEALSQIHSETPDLYEALRLAELVATPAADPASVVVTDSYAVMIECASEAEQKRLYGQLTEAGHKCKVLTI